MNRERPGTETVETDEGAYKIKMDPYMFARDDAMSMITEH